MPSKLNCLSKVPINKGINARADGGIPKDWLFLAMAHHHLDRPDEALRWLEKTGQWLESLHSGSDVSVWDRAEIEVIHREVARLLGVESSPSKTDPRAK